MNSATKASDGGARTKQNSPDVRVPSSNAQNESVKDSSKLELSESRKNRIGNHESSIDSNGLAPAGRLRQNLRN